jgi:hypothetical protein
MRSHGAGFERQNSIDENRVDIAERSEKLMEGIQIANSNVTIDIKSSKFIQEDQSRDVAFGSWSRIAR